MLLAWRALLADLGSPLPLPAAIRVMFIGQLGKYVPGAVWALAPRCDLARDYVVPRRRSATASLVGMATTLVVGLVAAGVMLPLTSASAVRHYWWVLAITPLAVACLYPKVIKFSLNLVLKVVRRPPLEKSVSVGGMARALAWSVGFLIIFFPGGIGPREIALIAVLAPVMPAASALVVALASRVVMTLGDLVWAGAGLTIGRGRTPRPTAPRAPSEPPARVSAWAELAGTRPSQAPDQRP